MAEVVIPWPSRDLSPNSRKHWARRAKAAKAYRATSHWLCRERGVGKMSGALMVSITFHPPDARRRDIDNMLASIKSGLDGISDAVGVDDSSWEISISKGKPEHGGKVVVRLTEKAAP